MRHFYRIYFWIYSQGKFPQSLASVRKDKFRNITWKLNHLTLMLIEWTLLNDIRNPIKNRDFKCKATLKFCEKQFNIVNSEYSKFFLYNNLLFITANSAEDFLDFEFVKINYFNGHHFVKKSLATVNSLKSVEIVLSKILKLYRTPPDPWMVSPIE